MTSLVLTAKQLTSIGAVLCTVAASGYVDMVKRFDDVSDKLALINTQNIVSAQMIKRLEEQSASNSKHIAELDLMVTELQTRAKCRKGNC